MAGNSGGKNRTIRIAGLVAIGVGLVWIGQGEGWFRYPRESFMIDDPTWSYVGAACVVAGLLALLLAARRR